MRVALDTNVLAYAEGLNGDGMFARARAILAALEPGSVVAPSQVLGELYAVLTRKGGRTRQAARSAIEDWSAFVEVVFPDRDIFEDALDLAAGHHLQVWDGLILASAARAGCELLLSEDMHPGFRWRGTTVANPFAEALAPELAALLRGS